MSNNDCLGVSILNRLGGKWKLPILWVISSHEVIRYNALKRSLCRITNTSLTRALKELESDGIILRKVYNSAMPHVEYTLANSTKKIIPAFDIIADWGKEVFDL